MTELRPNERTNNAAGSEEEQFLVLALHYLDGVADAEEEAALARRIHSDPRCRDWFVALCGQLGMLHEVFSAHAEEEVPAPEPLIPPIIIDTSPASLSYPAAFPFSMGGWLFSYAAATVIVGMAILGAWAYRVSLDSELAGGEPPPAPRDAVLTPVYVGRITGMADCRWADPQDAPSAAVPLGHRYALRSGLMEISYDSGARVILQGPATYEVDSLSGGFLSLGKLTARVETKGEGGRGKAEETDNQKSEVRSQKSPFVVRTPTAVVTDLGTEFGVEVDQAGATQSHVFRGKVELRVAEDGNRGFKVVPLGENESARVEINKEGSVSVSPASRREKVTAGAFVRQMPRWVRIEAYNTGVALKEGEPDPHWQLAARSDDPHFQPRAALVTRILPDYYRANDPAGSQWISQVGDLSALPEQVTYTFRTTFDLTGTLPEKALLRGQFMADDHVDAIRLNGRKVTVPDHGYEWPFVNWHTFKAAGGFVAGTNVLEIDVFNGNPEIIKAATQMACRVELEVLAVSDPAVRPTKSAGAGGGASAERAVAPFSQSSKTNN